MSLRALVVAVATPAVVVAVIACSSSSSQSGGADAASGPQSAGQPCDPSIAEPCYPTGDPCVGVVCDPLLLTCTEYDLDDGGPLCSANGAPCTTSADCATGLTCGFPAPAAGAANACTAAGQCINPPLACETDAASCGTQTSACGCNGLLDPTVVTGFWASPVASLTACLDGGPVIDSAAPDSSDASSAASDGAPSGTFDAGTDAPSDGAPE